MPSSLDPKTNRRKPDDRPIDYGLILFVTISLSSFLHEKQLHCPRRVAHQIALHLGRCLALSRGKTPHASREAYLDLISTAASPFAEAEAEVEAMNVSSEQSQTRRWIIGF